MLAELKRSFAVIGWSRAASHFCGEGVDQGVPSFEGWDRANRLLEKEDKHNLKHGLPGAIKQFRVLGMQLRVHLSHPFGQEPPDYTAPPGCSEEGIRSGRCGASGLGGHGCVPRERRGKMLPEPTEEEEESWGHEHHGGRAGRAGGYDALTLWR